MEIMYYIATQHNHNQDKWMQYCYAECHFAEHRYAQCRYAECHFAECRGAFKLDFYWA